MAESMSRDEIMTLPAAVDIATAARVLGISRGKAYELAKVGDFPTKILRLGRAWRVPTAELVRYLGLESGRSSTAPANAEDEQRRERLAHARSQRDKWAAEVDRLELGEAPRSAPSARSLLTSKGRA